MPQPSLAAASRRFTRMSHICTNQPHASTYSLSPKAAAGLKSSAESARHSAPRQLLFVSLQHSVNGGLPHWSLHRLPGTHIWISSGGCLSRNAQKEGGCHAHNVSRYCLERQQSVGHGLGGNTKPATGNKDVREGGGGAHAHARPTRYTVM